MSEIKVNDIKKRNGSSITIGENGDTVTVTAGATLSGSGASLTALNGSNVASGTVANARLVGSGAITINGSAVSLGGSVLLEKLNQQLLVLHQAQYLTQQQTLL